MKKLFISTIFLFIASLGYSQYIHDLFPCRDSSGARVEGCFAWSDSQGQYIQVTDTSFCLTDTLIVQYRTVNNAWGYDVGEIVMRDTLLGQCDQTIDTTSLSNRIDVNSQAIIDTASQIRGDIPDTTSLSDRIDGLDLQAVTDVGNSTTNGIGINRSPWALIDIDNEDVAFGLRIGSSTDNVSYMQFQNAASGIVDQATTGMTVGLNDVNGTILNRENGGFTIGTNGSTYIGITGNGNVGINRSIFSNFAQHTLDVNGDARIVDEFYLDTTPADSDNSATGILVHDDITSEVEKKTIGENEIVFGTASGGVESDANITITDSTINIAPDTYIKIDNDREIYAAGLQAGYSNTTGTRWIAQGYQAGFSSTTGARWIAQGFQAGFNNTTGNEWIAQGLQAGSSNTTGSGWIAQGYQAGLKNTTGARWIAQGYRAGFSNTTGNNWIAQGFFAGSSNTTGSDWMAQGYRAGNDNTTGNRWIAQGYLAGFSNTTGNNWMAQGYFAGYNNTTGSDWMAQGYQAGFSNTTGNNWMAQGYRAGSSNTTGNNWIAQGYQAGNDNTTGNRWIAQGFRAGYNANGSNYVITGSEAGRYVTGSNELDSINNSVLIGADAKSGADTVINVTVIGYDAEGHGSNTATVGNTSTNEFHSGNVGFDVSTTPSEGDIYKYDSGSGLFELVQPASDSIHGWAEYTDTIYTTSNRLSIAAGDTVTLANNAGETITSHLPLGVTSLYNATDTLITPDRSGDSYNIRVDFTASSSSNDGYFSLVLDIGGSKGIILSNLKTFPKGSGTKHDFSTTSAIYTLDTFIANGGKLKIIGEVGTTEIWDINLVIIRTSRARN